MGGLGKREALSHIIAPAIRDKCVDSVFVFCKLGKSGFRRPGFLFVVNARYLIKPLLFCLW